MAPAALEGLAFADVTDQVGLDYTPAGGNEDFALPTMTAGLALTRVGSALRVLLTSPSGPVGLFEVRDGRFRDITRHAGLHKIGSATAAAFADLDGDGDADLLLGRREHGVVTVLRNVEGRYRDVTKAVGVNPSTTARNPAGDKPDTRGIALADVNGDGHLDFLVADINRSMFGGAVYAPEDGGDAAACDFHAKLQHLSGPDIKRISQTRLYLGSAGGRFTEATASWGLDFDTSLVHTPQFVDINADALPDLLVTGPVCSNRVFLNDGGRRFAEVADFGGADVPQGNGSVVRDFDGDEVPDWLITGIAFPTATRACPAGNPLSSCAGNALLLGNGDGTFRRVPDADGLVDAGWAFGAVAEDFTNTGDLQVAVTNGFTGAPAATEETEDTQGAVYFGRFEQDPLALFVRENGRFVDAAAQIGLTDTGAGRGMAALDYDDDGRLDLLVNNADTGPRVFRNVTPATGRHWLRVALNNTGSSTNRSAVGSRIRVTTGSGRISTTWITSNGSFETQSLPEMHVGLGEEDGPVRVEVWWPHETTPDVHERVAIDQSVVIQR
ncbi:MAG TPA: FG-GAP-like repeat-containing protein [Nocardioides sp.]|uniref:FG-GAP-like repeat-containing protein n=1 Tax=Nocardioides sp. TaxID=35761 RepID=UPI002ED9772E